MRLANWTYQQAVNSKENLIIFIGWEETLNGNLTFINFSRIRKSNNSLSKKLYSQLNKKTGNIEASFASKLVATIDPENPVVDKFVLENVGLQLPYTYASGRVEKIIEIYKQLQKRFKVFLETDNGEYLVARFKEEYPGVNITNIKMADLVLWQSR